MDGYHEVQNASKLQWSLHHYSRKTCQAFSTWYRDHDSRKALSCI